MIAQHRRTNKSRCVESRFYSAKLQNQLSEVDNMFVNGAGSRTLDQEEPIGPTKCVVQSHSGVAVVTNDLTEKEGFQRL
jgi:hypothetical protein